MQEFEQYAVSPSNMYVGFVPLEETLKEEDQKDLVDKLTKATWNVSAIITANSMDLQQASLVVVEVEQANQKKKKAIPRSLTVTPELIAVPGFPALWEKFVANPGQVKGIEYVDGRTINTMTRCVVHFAHTADKVTVCKDHFVVCQGAVAVWKSFCERKFEKRDTLIGFEAEVQQYWADNKIFELDYTEGKEKWLGTFPYPYMNGALHLGHGFTITKVDFQVGFQRLKGKVALFPFAFHGTGMPIKACADRLKREIEEYGNPPDFTAKVAKQVEKKEEDSEAKMLKPQRRANAKTQQKGGGEKTQWEIMDASGIPQNEIAAFQDPWHWLDVFPPRTQKDLTSLGAKIDWRRSFTTTDLNPFYDAFVRWQFNKLNQLGKIKFGKRPTVYSPFDGQPCMDHDRRSGEKLGVSEFTIVKQEVLKPFPACLKQFEDSPLKFYFAPATLRPETMYGQTNCWILPDGQYGAYQINETDVFILTKRAARNLAFQDRSIKEGEVKELATFSGLELMGTKLHAPLSVYPTVYALPMMTISDKKTTGVVTSVPSDSPDDYAAYRDLQSKPALREKYGITEEMIKHEPVPIIEIPGLGNTAAIQVVNDLGIKSQNDKDLLVKAKDICYLKGFVDGVMLVGPYTGQKVQVAKQQVKADLIKAGDAVVYYEPEGEVISRSGDVCVVALCDQWYLNYGGDDPEWKAATQECLKSMNTYEPGTDLRDHMNEQIERIHQWACSRSYGLGTRIPWDKQYLVESLSDSTIYMAYYTIAHLIQGPGNYKGLNEGPEKIKPEQMTDEVFDYIFMNGALPKTDIPTSVLDRCRQEFNYFYPIDVRVTGKDLLNNHMVFWIYNHCAFWPKDKWPVGIKGNGWLLLNGSKMSKSTGNFVSISDACVIYGADSVRFAFAVGGDSLEDPNYTIENVETAILQTYTLLEWIKEMLAAQGTMKDSAELSYADRIFQSEMQSLVASTERAYTNYQYRDVLTQGFFEMIRARDDYRKRHPSTASMNWQMIKLFIRTIVIINSPILSHTCEYIWRSILKEEGSVVNAQWPVLGQHDQSLLDGNVYIGKFLANARSIMSKHKGKLNLCVSVAGEHPAYYQNVVGLMRKYYDAHGTLADVETAKLNQFVLAGYGAANKAEMTRVNKVIGLVKGEFATLGMAVFDVKSSFDEKALLEENSDYIVAQLNLTSFKVVLAVADDTGKGASPGKPALAFS